MKHLLWVFLLIVFAVSCWNSFKVQLAESYYLTGLSLILFVLVFLLVALDYRILGKQISIEPRIEEIENKQKELKEIATTLSKSILLTVYEASRYGGASTEGIKHIENYIKRIEKYVPETNILEIEQEKNEIQNEIEMKGKELRPEEKTA